MASRLTRWSVGTGVALGALMVLALPPEGHVLEVFFDTRYRVPTNALDAAVSANARAIDGTENALEWLEASAQFAPYMDPPRSPIVVRKKAHGVEFDPRSTAVAESLWRSIPHAPDAPRTLLIETTNPGWALWLSRDRPGLCIGTVMNERSFEHMALGVTRNAGGCYLATLYGKPGTALAGWTDSVRTMEIPRATLVMPRELRTVRPGNPQWAEPEFGYSRDDRFPWWGSLSLIACAEGREEYCVAALGFGPQGMRAIPSWYSANVLQGRVLAILHSEVGPDRFREIWRSDDPLPVAYERATGAPFGPWAKRFVEMHVGRIDKDNALSLAGWLGWALWMGLIMAWFAVRLRTKEAL